MDASRVLLIFLVAFGSHAFTFIQAVVLSEQQQVANFESSGYSIHKLDQHIQLKVFLYTMFAVERSEGGRCCKLYLATECPKQHIVCCHGWLKVFGTCVKYSWLEQKNVQNTLKAIAEASKKA